MKASSAKKTVGVRIDLTRDEHRAINLLAVMHGSGGAKPECAEAVRYWIAVHTSSDGQLLENPAGGELRVKALPKRGSPEKLAQSAREPRGSSS